MKKDSHRGMNSWSGAYLQAFFIVSNIDFPADDQKAGNEHDVGVRNISYRCVTYNKNKI